MFSTYLNMELELSMTEMVSNGETVNIIPHAALENAIYNNQHLSEYNIKVHIVPVQTNEPWHYAFMCSISDVYGRYVENVGEATESTLETEIAKGYPVLMAYKRAFDAAAILYLGLPPKVYSDQQIPTAAETATERSVTPDEDTFDDFEDDLSDAEDATPSAAVSVNNSDFDGDEWDDFGDDSDDNLGNDDFDGDEDDDSFDDFDDFDDDSGSDGDINDDRFDKVLSYGALRNKPTKLRECSNSTLKWIAETMSARTDAERADKALCAEFLKLKGVQ